MSLSRQPHRKSLKNCYLLQRDFGDLTMCFSQKSILFYPVKGTHLLTSGNCPKIKIQIRMLWSKSEELIARLSWSRIAKPYRTAAFADSVINDERHEWLEPSMNHSVTDIAINIDRNCMLTRNRLKFGYGGSHIKACISFILDGIGEHNVHSGACIQTQRR